MIDTQKNEEYYIYILLHALIYFLIVYCFYYIVEYIRYESLINKETLTVLNNKEIYEAFTFKNSDKPKIDIIRNVNRANRTDGRYYYPLILNLLIFIIAIACILLASKVYWKQFKRILYESILAGVYLLSLRTGFNINIGFNYDNIDKQNIYDNIIKDINNIIK